MDSEQVQVALRVRDLVPRERLEGFFSCIHVSQNAAVVGGERSFGFDFAFGPDSTQASVYDNSVKPLIESALSGVNVTVLAYGAPFHQLTVSYPLRLPSTVSPQICIWTYSSTIGNDRDYIYIYICLL